MTFDESVAMLPQWVQIWVMVLSAVIIGAILILLFSKATRIDAAIIFVAMVAVYPAMMWLYGQLGFVRLLGIVHVLIWTPLVIYLWRRLGDASITTPFRQVIWLLVGALLISLAFDYADVARYLMGERAPLTS